MLNSRRLFLTALFCTFFSFWNVRKAGKVLNYGYGQPNFGGAIGGFRLVRRLK